MRLIYWGVFISGFCALAYEVAWIRLLALVLGSSTYSFSVMLAAFIAGITFGSMLVTRRILPGINSYLLFGLAELAIGVFVMFTVPLYDKLPYVFMVAGFWLNHTPATFYIFELFKFLLCFCLMLMPTIALGMTLPLAARAITANVSQVGKNVGNIFSMNTLGNVLGAVMAGLFLLPRFGIKGIVDMGIVANLALGTAVVVTASWWNWKKKATTILLCVLVFLGYTQSVRVLEKEMLSYGSFRLHPNREVSYKEFKEFIKQTKLLFYQDDSSATVSVSQDTMGEIFLNVNGKADASSEGDLPTQVLSSQIPLLLKQDARDILVVGLGSGVTVGSALCHPIRRLDCVEISPAVIKAADFFKFVNHNALADPRLHMVVEDAKTFMAVTPSRYDIIINEPSNPWMVGTGNLFSSEFYKQVITHLNSGGMMVQWFHTYEMTDDILRMVLRTFSSEFKHVTLWNSREGDLILVGSMVPVCVDFKAMQQRFSQKDVANDLRRIEVEHLTTLLSLQVASDSIVRTIADKGSLNKDLFPVLEYEAPKAFFLGTSSSLVRDKDERLGVWRKRDLYFLAHLAERRMPLSREEFKGMMLFYQKYAQIFLKHILNEWLHQYPNDPDALWNLFLLNKSQGNEEVAQRRIQQLLDLMPGNPDYWEAAADLELEVYTKNSSYLRHIGPHKALAYFRRAIQAGANDKATLWQKVAQLYEMERKYPIAFKYYDRAIWWAQRNAGSKCKADFLCAQAAQAALNTGNTDKALFYLRKALRINPESIALRNDLALLEDQERKSN